MTNASHLQNQATLARLIQGKRETLNLSREALSEKSGLPLGVVEQLEEGRLLFLSVTNRTRLARSLKMTLQEIKQVESPPPITLLGDLRLLHVDASHVAHFNNGKRLALKEMERNNEGFWPCPDCGGELVTNTFLREDLENKSWTVFKIHCSHCLFKLDYETETEHL
jgi:hypothetical protein